ncbi:MAG: hypothetical protein WKF84_03720 [Pyrinomonadaceae bacterium]
MFYRLSVAGVRQVQQAIACGLMIALLTPFASAFAFTFPPQGDELTIADGSELSVVTTEEISSKTATEGDPVTFKVEEDFLVNNQVVIAKGAIAKGTISTAEKSGRLGKGGKLGIRVESTTTIDLMVRSNLRAVLKNAESSASTHQP